MCKYSLSQLSDSVLLHNLRSLDSRDHAITAELLAHIAEIDVRRLYAPAGYTSMFAYCVEVMHWSEGTAYKRIRAARSARRFPVIFEAVAAGRLHLSAIVLLSTHLTRENATELLTAATYRSKAETEQMLAARFPRPDVAPQIRALPARAPLAAPGAAPVFCTLELDSGAQQLSLGTVESHVRTEPCPNSRGPESMDSFPLSPYR